MLFLYIYLVHTTAVSLICCCCSLTKHHALSHWRQSLFVTDGLGLQEIAQNLWDWEKIPLCCIIKGVKVKVSPIYNPYVGECLLEDTCPGPSALWGRVASSFPHYFYLPSVSTGSPLLLGGQWAGIQPLARDRSRTVVFGTVGKRSNRYATRPVWKGVMKLKLQDIVEWK